MKIKQRNDDRKKKITTVKVLILKWLYKIISHQAEGIFFHKYISSLFPLCNSAYTMSSHLVHRDIKIFMTWLQKKCIYSYTVYKLRDTIRFLECLLHSKENGNLNFCFCSLVYGWIFSFINSAKGVQIPLLKTSYNDNQNDLCPTKSKSTVFTNRLKRFSV